MKADVMDYILKLCPDTKVTRRILSKIRINRIASYIIPKEDIILGEGSDEARQRVVEKYVAKRWRGISNTIKKAEHILAAADQYKDRPDKERIKNDMIFKRLAYGFEPDEYLCFGLEGKSPSEIGEWISDMDRYTYIFSMNNLKISQIFNNKNETYKVFQKYYNRDAVRVKVEADYPAFEKFVNAHTEFVKKPVFEGMGRGIELVKSGSISIRAYFEELISQGEHIIEEKIQQSAVMSALNASSVNTIRCITVNTRHGIVVPYTFLKVGRNGSFVDNGGAGGILAGIDENTGIITTHGYDEFLTEYPEHPDSGITFKGYRFPQWDEMKAMCCEMAAMIPSVKCIGWDVTLTDSGWAVVEGNGKTQLIGPQIVYQKGIKKEFLRLLDDVDLIC